MTEQLAGYEYPQTGPYVWVGYGNVAVEVHGPDGQVCIVGLPAEHALASIRERRYSDDVARQNEERAARLLAGREANVAWAERICAALNATERSES